MNHKPIKFIKNNFHKMEDFIIEQKATYKHLPTVHLNATTGECTIEGESYMEESVVFYEKILKWIKDYIHQQQGPVYLNIKLTYYNTSTSKQLYDIFMVLEQYRENGGTVGIKWFVDKEDEDLKEEITEMIEMTQLPIEMELFTRS